MINTLRRVTLIREICNKHNKMIFFKRYFHIIFVLWWGFASNCFSKTIYISNQQGFDLLNQQLNRVLNTGVRQVTVKFKPGIYYYSENHLNLTKIYSSSTSCNLDGDGAILVPRGDSYSRGDLFKGLFNPNLSIIDIEDMKVIPYWEDIRYAESRVELIDDKINLWRLKCSSLEDLSKDECINTYVIVTCWFTSYTLKVDQIKDGYLYFISSKKSYRNNYDCYFLDSDFGYSYGQRYARFKLCNYSENASFSIRKDNSISLSKTINSVHICNAGTFLTLRDCCFRSLSICGFTFLGATSYNNSYLLRCIKLRTRSLIVQDNYFKGLTSHVMGLEETDNLLFKNNIIEECYRGGVLVDNSCKGTQIVRNKFSYCGLDLKQDFPISVLGDNFWVTGNEILNYGYAAIRTGVWHGQTTINPPRGIIENNEIYFTPEYSSNIEKYGLMDGGAIYVSTQNESVIIRNNYIHDIAGIKDNRGIFCDDGARNISIYDNVILNIQNSYCIDSRRVSLYEDELGPTNVCNVIQGNIVNGAIRFEAREGDDNQCKLGINYFLIKDRQQMPKNKYQNIQADEMSKSIFYIERSNGTHQVSKQDFKMLSRTNARPIVKNLFVKM